MLITQQYVHVAECVREKKEEMLCPCKGIGHYCSSVCHPESQSCHESTQTRTQIHLKHMKVKMKRRYVDVTKIVGFLPK
jgi:hypothetical protein